jgi:hypothetical protein
MEYPNEALSDIDSDLADLMGKLALLRGRVD